MVQLSDPYVTIGKAIALTIWTFVGKVMSLLLNTLSSFVIAFLLRNILISWLQSLSAVILKPKKIDVVILPSSLVWLNSMAESRFWNIRWSLSSSKFFMELLTWNVISLKFFSETHVNISEQVPASRKCDRYGNCYTSLGGFCFSVNSVSAVCYILLSKSLALFLKNREAGASLVARG